MIIHGSGSYLHIIFKFTAQGRACREYLHFTINYEFVINVAYIRTFSEHGDTRLQHAMLCWSCFHHIWSE